MDVFLPIAEVSVNIIAIFTLSGIVGILSGLFGVGGGFLMTPFLIFLGVPPTYAVANEANNILATSVSGSTTHYLKNTLDYKMGLMIVIGGVFGTLTKKKLHVHYWIHGLPLRMRFQKSKLYESAFTPIIIGLIVGFIAAIMGIGGAFILVPAMIYIIGMPTKLIPGTSLFVTIFVSVIVTFLHAFNYGSIDLILVLMLVLGSIVGVQVGQKLGESVDSTGLKTLLAVLLLLVGIAIAYDTFFAEHANNEINKIDVNNLNPLSMFIKKLSAEMPILYGLFSILFAVTLGVGAAFIRRFFSNLRKKYSLKVK